MDIFISHSWKNKTFADKLARDLEGAGNVWIDHQQTKPGEEIGADISEGLERADLVILVWSRHAKKSNWVKQEIDQALALGIPVVPCLVDDKKLPKRLRTTLAIPFHDYTEGFGRLNLVIFKLGAADLGLDTGDMIGDFDDWDGVTDYLNNYRRENEVSGDAAYWIDRVLESSNVAQTGGSEFLAQYEGVAAYVQSLMDQIEAAQDDGQKLREILYEVIRNEDKAPPIMGKMRVMLEQMIDQLPAGSSVSAPGPGQASLQIGPNFRGETAASAPSDPRDQLRQHLQGRVPAGELEAIVEFLFYYNETAGPSLDALAGVVQARASAAGATVVQHLVAYLQNPDDLLPESSYGYYGYIDDAWLIHNTAYRLVEAGILPPATFAVEWGNIQAADNLVRQLLPPMALSQLENTLMQYLQVIAAEIQAYQPQFMQGAGGYHPYMGEQSNDDRWMDVMTDSLNYL